ncbi:MAG TPA: VPDSG-CTERM sorting domain-containing protein [Verrucomicrobiae bacterium]|nr:VPDSG-CTERM sorting domain-containing protein [Verrucomicrobiae bacterium]
MKNILKVAAVAAVAAVLTTTVQATPITGVIGFAGTAALDQPTASSSTEVLSWGNNNIGLHSGTFASLSPLATVALASPWFFNSGAKNNFWVVTDITGTYTFNLSSSSVFSTGNANGTTSISIFLAGTVVSTIAGLDPTAFTGSMTIQDPSVANGNKTYSYTESISFSSVPDGGTTVLLLGSALSGLALLRRKLSA